jgi:uncharacterized protein
MPAPIRIAATGDLHAGASDGARVRDVFRAVAAKADLIALAGDLTHYGQMDEIVVVAEACRTVQIPVVAVLGNHDWQSDRAGELAGALTEAGVSVLDRTHVILPVAGTSVGVAGVKGFIGGFGEQWANFGEPFFRSAYAETTRDVDGLDEALRAIEPCGVRIALLHYAPIAATLAGEPERLWLVLGTERLAAPLRAHRPDLVLHGHAHSGAPYGHVDGVPVYNVGVEVTGQPFAIFQIHPRGAPGEPARVTQVG